jgi:hypothetical protein
MSGLTPIKPVGVNRKEGSYRKFFASVIFPQKWLSDLVFRVQS